MLPFDLHVLGLPLAFILSQDQTLHSLISLIQVLLPNILLNASLYFNDLSFLLRLQIYNNYL
jgi:hypothetical protein